MVKKSPIKTEDSPKTESESSLLGDSPKIELAEERPSTLSNEELSQVASIKEEEDLLQKSKKKEKIRGINTQLRIVENYIGEIFKRVVD